MSTERIELKPFRLDRKAYLGILLRVLLRKRGLLYAVMIVMGVAFLIASRGRTVIVVAGLANLLYPLLVMFYCVGLTRKEANHSLYEERIAVLDADGISMRMSGGATSTVPWSYVTDLVELERYVLLYISANSFVFLERAAFPHSGAEVLFKHWLEEGRRS